MQVAAVLSAVRSVAAEEMRSAMQVVEESSESVMHVEVRSGVSDCGTAGQLMASLDRFFPFAVKSKQHNDFTPASATLLEMLGQKNHENG